MLEAPCATKPKGFDASNTSLHSSAMGSSAILLPALPHGPRDLLKSDPARMFSWLWPLVHLILTLFISHGTAHKHHCLLINGYASLLQSYLHGLNLLSDASATTQQLEGTGKTNSWLCVCQFPGLTFRCLAVGPRPSQPCPCWRGVAASA